MPSTVGRHSCLVGRYKYHGGDSCRYCCRRKDGRVSVYFSLWYVSVVHHILILEGGLEYFRRMKGMWCAGVPVPVSVRRYIRYCTPEYLVGYFFQSIPPCTPVYTWYFESLSWELEYPVIQDHIPATSRRDRLCLSYGVSTILITPPVSSATCRA